MSHTVRKMYYTCLFLLLVELRYKKKKLVIFTIKHTSLKNRVESSL